MSSLSIDTARAWMQAYAQVLEENKEYLTELDSAIGNADHGTNMTRGMDAAVKPMSLDQPDLATLFKKISLALVSKVGGTTGSLYDTFFVQAAKETGDAGSLDAAGLSCVLHAGLQGVLDHGKAELQDRTMVDAMTPALEAFDAAATTGLTVAATAVGKVTRAGAGATTSLLAHKGRAPCLDERLVGHQDPGATFNAYSFETLVKAIS